MFQKQKVILIALLGIVLTSPLRAQKPGFDMEAGLIASPIVDHGLPYYFTGAYNLWFSQYFAVSGGLVFLHSNIDQSFRSPKETNIVYELEDDIINLNGALGIKLVTPVYKNTGLMADVKFLFSPLPLYKINADKYFMPPVDWNEFPAGANYYQESPFVGDASKVVYTRFNPSFMFKGGFFFESNSPMNGDGKGRIVIGMGIGRYNPYNAYYRGTLDGIPLKKYLKVNSHENTYSVFVQISI
jgi:hypothetical protein